MTPPEKNVVRRVGKPTLYERGCHRPIFPHHWLKQSACGKSLLADAGRGDLLETIIDRVELRPNGLRMILSLVPLTPAAAPPNRLQVCVFTREFPLRIKRRGVEMRFAIDAPDPRATNPDPVLLKEVKRARRCFDALVSGRIGSVAELASLEGISDRYEAVASVVI